MGSTSCVADQYKCLYNYNYLELDRPRLEALLNQLSAVYLWAHTTDVT